MAAESDILRLADDPDLSVEISTGTEHWQVGKASKRTRSASPAHTRASASCAIRDTAKTGGDAAAEAAANTEIAAIERDMMILALTP